MVARSTAAAALILLLILLLPACSSGQTAGPPPPPTSDIEATVQAVLQLTPAVLPAQPQAKPVQPQAGSPPTRTPSPTPSPTPTRAPLDIELPINVGPSRFPDDVNPLTGMRVQNPALLDRRPLAVKITNFPRRVRPQSGLMLADQVFEYYIENGLTRFIAVFYGNNVDRVGPVRSGRFFDEHVVRMYNAIFAFASADRRVLEPWLESDLVSRLVYPPGTSCPPLCRDESNPDYNNLYADTSQLGQYAVASGSDNARPDLDGLRFQTLVPWGGNVAEQLVVRYSRFDYNAWLYNRETGTYQRMQDAADDTGQGEKYDLLLDDYTGEQVQAANVIVLFVPYEEFVRSNETEIFKINLEGAGTGYAFRDGQVFEITWNRPALDAPLQILRAGPGAGSHFPLKPGNTFYQIVGVTSDVLKGEDAWRFTFATP